MDQQRKNHSQQQVSDLVLLANQVLAEGAQGKQGLTRIVDAFCMVSNEDQLEVLRRLTPSKRALLMDALNSTKQEQRSLHPATEEYTDYWSKYSDVEKVRIEQTMEGLDAFRDHLKRMKAT
mmetsp:Transcript_19500/g.48875  ORF Transcript_19500/g.48875 Transcript_19500/m.48875 type:complete len:121 (+) Transcript_19500:88-450(+)